MPLNIAIAGAGIGGLAAAIALARQGHKVTIYERATSTTDVGFAFRITPNSDRCLKYFGIDTEAGGAVASNSMKMIDGHNGKIIMQRRENEDKEQAKSATSVFAFRPQLTKQLVDVAESLGVEIKTGVKVVSVNTEKTVLILEGGQEISADLIVGCDGLHSVLRPYIVDPKKYYPKATAGRNCIRFMLSRSAVENDPLLSELINDNSRMAIWKGDTAERMILVYPVDFSNQYNINCVYPEELTDTKTSPDSEADETEKITYNQAISRSAALDIYSDWEDRARRIIELGDPDGFRYWKLQDLDETPTWHVNRTVLTGDAIHTMLPMGFSGASMAIEDGVILGELLPKDVEVEQISDRLKLFESVRRPRTDRVRETSRESAKSQQAFVPGYFEFLAEYDAPADGKRVLKEALSKSS